MELNSVFWKLFEKIPWKNLVSHWLSKFLYEFSNKLTTFSFDFFWFGSHLRSIKNYRNTFHAQNLVWGVISLLFLFTLANFTSLLLLFFLKILIIHQYFLAKTWDQLFYTIPAGTEKEYINRIFFRCKPFCFQINI